MLNVVVAFVEDGRGRFLVQPRIADPGLVATGPGDPWELPGGKLAPGEDHAAALAREVLEETGLGVEVGELVCALCHDYGGLRVALHAYRCALAGAPLSGAADLSGPSRPARAARWVTPDECRALAIPAANPPLLDAFAWERAHG